MGVFSVGGGAGVACGSSTDGQAGAGCTVTENQLFEAMCQNFGVLTCAALSVGLTLASLVQRVARSKRLRAARDGARSVLIRHADERLQLALSAGETWALQFCARAGVKTGVPADAGKPLELLSFPSNRVAQPVGQGEPRPDLAEALSRQLVVALDRSEPWAVMYCLSHLDPEGPFYAKCRRGRQHDLWAEQLMAAPMVTESAAEVGDTNGLLRAVDGAVDVPEENGEAEPRLMVDADEGLAGLVAAPPVCGEFEETLMASSAPPVTGAIASAEADSTEAAGIAPPVNARGVNLGLQLSCRFRMAASAEADATEAACLAPPVCGGQFERRLRLHAVGRFQGCAACLRADGANFDQRYRATCLENCRIDPDQRTAPPVSTRGVDLYPRPDCRPLMAASAQADATKAACRRSRPRTKSRTTSHTLLKGL